MKRIKLILILFISIFICNIKVFAGASLSVSTNSVTKGDSFTVNVNMSGAAAWNIHVSASGPVSGCSINQADATADAMDTSKTFSATCTSTGAGTITINLSGDVTSANDGIPVMLGGSATVTVTEPAPTPTPQPAPSTPQNNYSGNNNLGSLSVEGYDLTKVDNNSYTLTVSNSVTSVNINATAEDSKATVTGNGNHGLNIGENNIEVIVTAESGAQNKINIKVIRKDGYYLEDLKLLNDKEIKDMDIIIDLDNKIKKEDLNTIKESGKIVNLNYYNENKQLIYSWSIDGSKIKDTKEFSTKVTYETENVKEISKITNYAEGMYVNFDHSGKLPKGTKIKLYVGDKFENDSLVNVYHYDNKKLNDIEDSLIVKEGYIEFEIEHCSEYFVTMSNINQNTKTNSATIMLLIISIIEFIALAVVSTLYILKLRKEKSIS